MSCKSIGVIEDPTECITAYHSLPVGLYLVDTFDYAASAMSATAVRHLCYVRRNCCPGS